MNKWGLIPAWSKDPKIGFSLKNARAETVDEKPAFRSAFKSRALSLIPSSGFYEWQPTGGKHKQPYYFRRSDGAALLGFAGLWEHWRNSEGQSIETCSIITTTANGVVRPVHDRMLVILDPTQYGQWLDPRGQCGRIVGDTQAGGGGMWMTAFPVSSYGQFKWMSSDPAQAAFFSTVAYSSGRRQMAERAPAPRRPRQSGSRLPVSGRARRGRGCGWPQSGQDTFSPHRGCSRRGAAGRAAEDGHNGLRVVLADWTAQGAAGQGNSHCRHPPRRGSRSEGESGKGDTARRWQEPAEEAIE